MKCEEGPFPRSCDRAETSISAKRRPEANRVRDRGSVPDGVGEEERKEKEEGGRENSRNLTTPQTWWGNKNKM